MGSTEEPILSRLDRLDTMLRQLEGIRENSIRSSPKSSWASTPSSGPITSDGGNSSSTADLSPKSREKYCRPIDDVVLETKVKGSVIDRLVLVENRVSQLCLQIEEEIEAEKKRLKGTESLTPNHKKKKKGLKQLVKSCVKGNTQNESQQG